MCNKCENRDPVICALCDEHYGKKREQEVEQIIAEILQRSS